MLSINFEDREELYLAIQASIDEGDFDDMDRIFTQRLDGKHAVQFNANTGTLKIANDRAQLLLAREEANNLLQFLYDHREDLECPLEEERITLKLLLINDREITDEGISDQDALDYLYRQFYNPSIWDNKTIEAIRHYAKRQLHVELAEGQLTESQIAWLDHEALIGNWEVEDEDDA